MSSVPPRPPYLTSGDVARLLSVDLKTVHNWVSRGHLRGWRTQGRHLRFRRTELLSFMRQFGYPVPAALGDAPVAVVSMRCPGIHVELGPTILLHRSPNIFAAALDLAGGENEALVVDLDRYPSELVVELLNALAERDVTRGVAVVGVTDREQARKQFLASGGAAVTPVGQTEALVEALMYLVAGGPTPSPLVRLPPSSP